jgi:hypothetical protein
MAEVLNSLSADQVVEFCNASLDFIELGSSKQAEANYVRFAQSLGGNANSKPMRLAVVAITDIFTDALQHNLSPEAIANKVVNCGVDASRAKVVMDIWKTRLPGLILAQVRRISQVNELVDMQWRFGGKLLLSNVQVN